MEFSTGRIALLLASQRPPVTIYFLLDVLLWFVVLTVKNKSCLAPQVWREQLFLGCSPGLSDSVQMVWFRPSRQWDGA